MPPPPKIGFVCPLYIELKAVLATFDERPNAVNDSGTRYIHGTIAGYDAVAVGLPHKATGPVQAARCADKLLHDYPNLKNAGSYCFLVGIAGGIWSSSKDVRLSDVVIATYVWDWRSGKDTDKGFEPTSYPVQAPLFLRQELDRFLDGLNPSKLKQNIASLVFRMKNKAQEDRWEYPGKGTDVLYGPDYQHRGQDTCDECDLDQAQRRKERPTIHPTVHTGIVASGNAVLKKTSRRAKLQRSKAFAVEMEACGMPENFVVIRGISDYADSHKNDAWQPYAAATAAACARLLVEHLTEDMSYPQPEGETPPSTANANERRHGFSRGRPATAPAVNGLARPRPPSSNANTGQLDNRRRGQEYTIESTPIPGWTEGRHSQASLPTREPDQPTHIFVPGRGIERNLIMERPGEFSAQEPLASPINGRMYVYRLIKVKVANIWQGQDGYVIRAYDWPIVENLLKLKEQSLSYARNAREAHGRQRRPKDDDNDENDGSHDNDNSNDNDDSDDHENGGDDDDHENGGNDDDARYRRHRDSTADTRDNNRPLPTRGARYPEESLPDRQPPRQATQGSNGRSAGRSSKSSTETYYTPSSRFCKRK